MAGVASRLSRKDLEFMAGDIGSEIIAVMDAEMVLKGLSAEKQEALLSRMLDSANMEKLVNKMSPAHQKRLLELALKLVAADLTTDTEHDSKGNN